jgi:thioredoxin 1
METKIYEPKNIDEYNDLIEKLVNDNKVYIIDFFAKWCKPCQKLGKFFETDVYFSDDKNKFAIIKIDVDNEEFNDLTEMHKVEELPYVIFYKDNQLYHTSVAGHDENLIKTITMKLVN